MYSSGILEFIISYKLHPYVAKKKIKYDMTSDILVTSVFVTNTIVE